MPYLGQPMPDAAHTPAVALPPAAINQTQAEHLQMAMPGPAVNPIDPLSLPVVETVMPGAAPASQTSVGTSASNAFEEVTDGLNFGSELFGAEPWSVFSPGWSSLGHFPGNSA